MLRVIAFVQNGCMACEEQEPINREVESALGIRIERIDPLRERDYIGKYDLRVTPTILIIRDGTVTGRFEGVVQREQLAEAIRNFL